MDTSNMKNIVVLRDLPSNIVDEAIIILKSNVNLKKYDLIDNKKENVKIGAKAKIGSKDYIIKEAESVISSYISSIERPKDLECKNKKLAQKYKNVKVLTVFFGIIAIFGIVVNLI